jgi:hypothetical protein
MLRLRVTALLVAAAFLLHVNPASAQTYQCGDLQLVFKNDDLQPGADGFIRAQGQFFAQFQAIGDQADKITVFAFSFGPHSTDFNEDACTRPIWFTGQAVINYRADRDASDGFFIPLVTPLVPDGTYTAAVHAYDATNTELARFWAKAIVDNCDGGDGAYCRSDAEQHLKQDKTAPWPIILPGDGTAMQGRALSIEFGEAIANYTVLLNGEDITSQMTEWDGRVWDADTVPDYGPYGLGNTVAPPCSLPEPIHQCMKYGPAYEWNVRPLTDADVLRVEAYDLAGNLGVKTIHIGSSVAGGAVSAQVPILSFSVDKLRDSINPAGTAVFAFTLSNSGNAEGHPFASATVPPGWSYEWVPNHVVVKSGEVKKQDLQVTAPRNATGSFEVTALLEYQQGSAKKVLEQKLTINVGNLPGGPAANTTTTKEKKDSPLPALPLVLAGLALLAAVRRRM